MVGFHRLGYFRPWVPETSGLWVSETVRGLKDTMGLVFFCFFLHSDTGEFCGQATVCIGAMAWEYLQSERLSHWSGYG